MKMRLKNVFESQGEIEDMQTIRNKQSQQFELVQNERERETDRQSRKDFSFDDVGRLNNSGRVSFRLFVFSLLFM